MADRTRGGARLKYTVIIAVLIASALSFTASTQTWYTVQLGAASGHTAAISVSGSTAAPAIAALSLAGVALAGALSLAGRVLRYLLALLGLILSAALIGSTISAIVDPIAAARTVITTATGIAGDASVHRLVVATHTTAWPALSLVAGILLALACLAVAATAHRWPTASRRYGATAPVDGGSDPGGDSDATPAAQHAPAPDSAAFTRSLPPGPGGDATSSMPATTGEGLTDTETNRVSATPLTEAELRTQAREAAIDDWDELSRGDDPTTDSGNAPTDGVEPRDPHPRSGPAGDGPTGSVR